MGRRFAHTGGDAERLGEGQGRFRADRPASARLPPCRDGSGRGNRPSGRQRAGELPESLGDCTRWSRASTMTPAKPFQSATVRAALEALTSATGLRRFLVADEVGLGKTIVARDIVQHIAANAKRQTV